MVKKMVCFVFVFRLNGRFLFSRPAYYFILACEMPTVLIFSSEFPPGPGGIAEHAYQLAVQLSSSGFKVIVLSTQDYVDKEAVSIFNSRQNFKVLSLRHYRSSSFFQLYRIFKLFAACLTNWPELVIASGATPGVCSVLVQKLLGQKRLCVIHGPEYHITFSPWLTHYGLSGARLVAVSRFSREFIRKTLPGSNIQVINNAAVHIPLSDPDHAESLRSEYKGKNVLLTVGTIYYRKGQHIVIKSLPRILRFFPDTVYLIIGNGRKEQEFRELAVSLNVEHAVKFIGQISKADIAAYLALCDIYLLTSQVLADGDFEGFGISIIEAALWGKPAIGTRNNGIEDAIEDGKTGLLTNLDSPDETAEAVIKLLGDPSLRTSMGEAAKTRAEQEYNWKRIGSHYISLINTILD
ncbi:MAG: glycosyltransferase family 4 protein [Fibrobacteria bacterium]|nr:glycosyltransferase family 4 protein [Fibrobacteria bacterium]